MLIKLSEIFLKRNHDHKCVKKIISASIANSQNKASDNDSKISDEGHFSDYVLKS